ncbi:MAG: hypothetical protein GY715_01530 [Planctomycetes bacterium]|nr:hypothetical protein [Planctomycetota bacterium]
MSERSGSSAAAPRLHFSLTHGRYAIRLERIGTLLEPRDVRPVPLAPPTVVGLAVWRGRPMIVVEPAVLLADPWPGGGALFLRLAEPYPHVAWRVPRNASLARDAGSDDGLRHALVDPVRMMRELCEVEMER